MDDVDPSNSNVHILLANMPRLNKLIKTDAVISYEVKEKSML